MRINATKAKLAQDQPVFGSIIAGNWPDIVELLGAIGYDFVMIDCEHGAMTHEQVENMVRAAEVFGITPLVRVPDHGEATILRYLDRGAQGIIVPHVNSGPEAEAVSRAARYFPEGDRGASSGRAHDYNVDMTRVESSKWINEQVLVVVMAEETTAIGNLDRIVAVPGVDVVHVAANDLTQSMGNPDPSEVRKLMREVVGRIRAGGKAAGVGGNSPSDPRGAAEFVDLGARFVTIPALGLLRRGAESFKRDVEAALLPAGH